MNTLPQTTKRRLKKIPQMPNVWEGDRRSLGKIAAQFEPGQNEADCILWVDGSDAVVRGMDFVPPETGPEAMVRALIRAMENPPNQFPPCRPKKIVVRDREIQFFLRGALQGLDIQIEYNARLPIIDEILAQMEEHFQTPDLPEKYQASLTAIAYKLWELAPWQNLADNDIISVQIVGHELDTLYACIMGMLGQEYGVIFYRSLESLKRFRAAALGNGPMEQLEEAFLSQDCWFLNFDKKNASPDEDYTLAELPLEEIEPLFGSVHPYEGMRPFLDEEEAETLHLALSGLYEFFKQHHKQLGKNLKKALQNNYSLASLNPKAGAIAVNVSTLPDLAKELLDMAKDYEEEDDEEEDDDDDFILRDDLIPKGSCLSLGMIPWDTIEMIKTISKLVIDGQFPPKEIGEGLPVIMVQTTKGKAQEMIKQLQSEGGLSGIGFNPGEDILREQFYDLGILQTKQNHYYLFGEFADTNPVHRQARKKWDERTKKLKGYCGLVITMGVSGSSKGKPQPKHMMGLFLTKVITQKDLGVGVFRLIPQIDF